MTEIYPDKQVRVARVTTPDDTEAAVHELTPDKLEASAVVTV